MADISYNKINIKNKRELTSKVLHDMYSIDGVFGKQNIDVETIGHDKKYRKELEQAYQRIIKERLNKGNYVFYFMYNKTKLFGFAYGEFTAKNKFFLDCISIDSNQKMKGNGTKLLARVVADLRVNHNINEITMLPRAGTKEINKKVTGNRSIKFKINEEPKEILRRFNSNFKYDLKIIPEKKDRSYIEKILIKKNIKRL